MKSVGKKRSLMKGENSTVLLIFICFVILIVAIQLIGMGTSGEMAWPSFISPVNLLNIVMQSASVGIMAMGMAMIMISGGIDLSVGMLTSMVAIFAAKASVDWGWSIGGALVMAVVLAVALEAGMGFIISRLKVEPFIITLGGMILARGIALLICLSKEVRTEGLVDPIKTNILEGAKDPATGLQLTLPIYVLIFIGITIFIWWLMKYTKFGRRIYAVGANENAAYLAGINVKNIKLSTYMINGLLVGIGAIVLLARANTAIITLGQNLEIDVIAAVVVGGVAMSGGKGNIWGVFIGVILMGAIQNGMNILKINAEWQFVVKGLIIIAAVSAGAITDTLKQKATIKAQKEALMAAKKAE